MNSKKNAYSQSYRPSRRTFLKTTGALSVLFAAPATIGRANAGPLYVNTWGGVWQECAEKFFFRPFTAKTGIEVRTISPVSFAKLSAQARTGTYDFDMTTVSGSQVIQAQAAGILEPVNTNVIDAVGLPKGSVFMDSVASHCYSTNIAFNTKYFEPGRIKSWIDVWDVKANPGPRSFNQSATDYVPIALMGDGVPHNKLYPPDVDRVFTSLDKIKSSIPVWWKESAQSRQLLANGDAYVISMWNGAAQKAKADGLPIEFIWNDAKINRVYWVVSKGTPRAETAWQLIKFMIEPENLAKFCAPQQVGPLYPKAFEYINKADAEQMPTYPDNYKVAVEENAASIGPMLTNITKRFNMWLAS